MAVFLSFNPSEAMVFDILLTAKFTCPCACWELPRGVSGESVVIGIHSHFLDIRLKIRVAARLVAKRLEGFDKPLQRVLAWDVRRPVGEGTWIRPPPFSRIPRRPGDTVIPGRLKAGDAVASERELGEAVFHVRRRHLKVAVCVGPRQPIVGHRLQITGMVVRHGILPRDCPKRPEPVVRLAA